MMLKNIKIIFPIIFLSIGLFGCQQDSEGLNPDNNNVKQSEVTSTEETEVIGVITEVNHEDKRVLLELSKKINEDEEQLWVTIGENTKITKENEVLNFENLKPGVELKVNLSGMCFDSNPRICFAEKIVIE